MLLECHSEVVDTQDSHDPKQETMHKHLANNE